MEGSSIKFIGTFLMLCEITAFVIAIPIRDSSFDHVNSRGVRSAQIFGFGINTPFSVSNPISSAQGTLNNIGNLFQPASNNLPRNNNGNNNRKQYYSSPEYQNGINMMKFMYNRQGVMFVPNKGNMVRTFEPVIPNNVINNKPVTDVPENVILNDDTKGDSILQKQVTRKHHKTASDNIIVTAEMTISPNTVSSTAKETKVNVNKMKIDKKLIDLIFMSNDNIIDGITTEVTETTDCTTETGDYESTTYIDLDDDLLRIPAPVVASLLG